MRGNLDGYGHQLVARAAAAQMGNTLPAQAEDFTRLGAGGDSQVHLAVERGDTDLVAEDRLGDIYIQIKQYVIAFAAEEVMFADVDFKVEVPVRTAVGARLAFACQANLGRQGRHRPGC